MSALKTQATNEDVHSFIRSVQNKQRQLDTMALLAIYESITQQPAVMWGTSIIGFGTYQYKTKDGQTNTFLRSGFSPRIKNMSVYVGAAMSAYPELLDGLGKHSILKACLYFTKLANVDELVLRKLIKADLDIMNQRYPPTD